MARRAKIIPFPGVRVDATPPPARPDDRGFVEVHRCDQAEAIVLKSLFESHGIPTLLRSRLIHSVHPFTVGAQGEVVICVPEAEAIRSRALLARTPSRPPLS
ncbi:MAG: hypothetical protein HY294_03850 [Candidatus Rokubacteria bacterium]|nr:hypothetical protein [Candidatus Rokubacteria bacterium]MBI3825110.1 hypothetical protein [Candidatus Rokubacteria bacterium]